MIMSCRLLLLLSKKEKEKLVIKLAKEDKTTREIAKEVHISLKDIGKILRRLTGDEDANKEEIKKEEQKLKKLSPYAQVFQMFRENKDLAEVVVELDLNTNIVLDYYCDYLRLTNMRNLVIVYKESKDDLPLFLHLYRRIKKEGLDKQAITDLLQNQHRLVELDRIVDFYNNHIKGLKMQKAHLEQEIREIRSYQNNIQ